MAVMSVLILAVIVIGFVRHAARLDALERRLDALQREIDRPRPQPQIQIQPVPAPPVREPASGTTAVPPPPVVPPEAPPRPAPPLASPPPPPRIPPPPPTTAAPPSRPSLPSVDWEQLFGVRGAAILGAIALGLAGLLFFRYSIEHGLFPPWLRVVTGAVIGIGAIASSELLLRREYGTTANAIAGAGSIVLFAAWWAAAVRYHLIALPVAYALMVLTTVATCALSWRHRSQEIAMLALVGGFLTPLLLSSGRDNPIGLFSYLLLLDIGLLALARQRAWTRVALLCLTGTLLYQAGWILFRMDRAEVGVGFGVITVFALTFGVASALLRNTLPERASHGLSALGAVLLPAAFAVTIAGRSDLAAPLCAVGALVVLLTAGACWLANVHRDRHLAMAAVTVGLVVLLAWMTAHPMTGSAPWQLATIVVALALVTQLFAEREGAGAPDEPPSSAPLIAGFGGLLPFGLLVWTPAASTPLLTVAVALGAILVRHAASSGRTAVLTTTSIAIGVLLSTWHVFGNEHSWAFRIAVLLGFAIVQGLVAGTRRDASQRRAADHGAAAYGVLTLLALPVASPFLATLLNWPTPPVWVPAGALALVGSVLLAAARARVGGWLLGAVVAGAWATAVWTVRVSDANAVLPGLLLILAAVVACTAWPFVTWPALAQDRLAWRAAAMAGPAWFWSIHTLFIRRFGDAAIGLVPLALGAVAATATLAARRRWPEDDPMWTSAMAWLGATALGFVALAIPLQLENEWVTIGWALQGLAILALWTRVDHPGLKYAAFGLFTATTLRLVANPAVLGYHPRPAWRIVNWIAYTYLVPAATLGTAATMLAARETARLREWEPRGPGDRPLVAAVTGIASLVIVFVWINLAVTEWFTTGPYVSLSFARLPARDLALSIAWAVYALALLALGVWRTHQGLRWASLVLLLGTIAKVFLHDLGELQDLYRVASLVGLAVSLFVVSLAYQRFVFRAGTSERTSP